MLNYRKRGTPMQALSTPVLIPRMKNTTVQKHSTAVHTVFSFRHGRATQEHGCAELGFLGKIGHARPCQY